MLIVEPILGCLATVLGQVGPTTETLIYNKFGPLMNLRHVKPGCGYVELMLGHLAPILNQVFGLGL